MMILRLLFILIGSFTLQSLYSQPFFYFNKQILLDESNQLSVATIPHEEGYYTVGVFGFTHPIIYFANVYVEGTLLEYHILDDSQYNTTIVSGKQFIQTEDGNFVLTYQQRVPLADSNSDVIIIKFTKEGEVLWKQQFGFESVDSSNEVIQTTDGGFMVVGYSWTETQRRMYVIKTDSRGRLEWEKTYCLEGSTWCGVYSVIEVKGGFVLGGLDSNEAEDKGMYVVKIDKLGNQKWAKHYGVSADDFACQIYLLEDGNLLLKGGFWKNGIREIYNAKLDSSGTIIWEKLYYLPDLWGIQTPLVFREDGGFIGVAAYEKGTINTPLIMNFDANGDTLWTKSITPDSTANVHVRDIDKIEGGYVLTGFKFSPIPQYGWMVSIDEEGNFCEELGCVETVVDIEDIAVEKEVFVQFTPNPATIQTTIHYQIPKGGRLKVYDYQGREVESYTLVANERKLLLKFENWVSGVYFYGIEIEGERIKGGKFVVE